MKTRRVDLDAVQGNYVNEKTAFEEARAMKNRLSDRGADMETCYEKIANIFGNDIASSLYPWR